MLDHEGKSSSHVSIFFSLHVYLVIPYPLDESVPCFHAFPHACIIVSFLSQCVPGNNVNEIHHIVILIHPIATGNFCNDLLCCQMAFENGRLSEKMVSVQPFGISLSGILPVKNKQMLIFHKHIPRGEVAMI